MARQLTNAKRWIKPLLKEQKMSQADLARRIGISPPALSNTLKGGRRLQIPEAAEIANALMRPVREVLEAFGQVYRDSLFSNQMNVVGYVAAEEVIWYDEDAPDFGYETLSVPFIGFDGKILAIKGDSASPRYLSGEHIGIGEEIHPSTQIGSEVVAKIDEGRMVLKRLERGEGASYILASLNPAFPPIQPKKIDWVARVLLHFPDGRRRQGF